jgi:hypothetical protein
VSGTLPAVIIISFILNSGESCAVIDERAKKATPANKMNLFKIVNPSNYFKKKLFMKKS